MPLSPDSFYKKYQFLAPFLEQSYYKAFQLIPKEIRETEKLLPEFLCLLLTEFLSHGVSLDCTQTNIDLAEKLVPQILAELDGYRREIEETSEK